MEALRQKLLKESLSRLLQAVSVEPDSDELRSRCECRPRKGPGLQAGNRGEHGAPTGIRTPELAWKECNSIPFQGDLAVEFPREDGGFKPLIQVWLSLQHIFTS